MQTLQIWLYAALSICGTLLDCRHLFSVSVSDICEASIHSV